MHRRSFWLAVGSAGALALPAVVQAQAPGVITGAITDAVSGQPVPAAQISVVGTNIGALTNDAGRYTIRGVPARQVTVRVLRVGYTEQSKPATVTGAGPLTLDFALRTASVSLTPVVTTATGEARRVEQGNAIAAVDAARLVETSPVTSVGDLLTARAPGVNVLPSNITGTAPRVRIRGTSSLSLTNNPIYVIDGVRMTSTNIDAGTGGATVSRVSDINPEEIESIEVVKGPSAATLYGTAAANGVIVINTKKGRAGAARWTAYGEGGLIQQRNNFPTAYSGWGKANSNGAVTQTCDLARQANTGTGGCKLDSLSTYNLFDDAEVSPFGNGHRQQYGLQLTGGSEQVRFFSSGEYETETGALRMPDAAVDLLRARSFDVREQWQRPNVLGRGSARVNVTATPNPKIDLNLQTSYIQLDSRLPQSDNNTFGLFSSAYGGPGYKYQISPGDTTPGGLPRLGYRLLNPAEINRSQAENRNNRFVGSLNGNVRPTSWLSGRANLGIDYTSSRFESLCRYAECPGSTTRILGSASDGRFNIYNYTVDASGTANFNPRSWLNSRTTVGSQYVYSALDQNNASASELSPGAVTPAGGVTPSVGAGTQLSKTLGAFVEQQLGIRDRLFLTGALRTDQNNAFGTNFQSVYYPKASVSWIVSDEGFFPKFGWLDQLRVRSAYGASGVQPNATDAITYFSPGTTNVDRTDRATLLQGAIGNPNLKPERSTETEAGFEARLFGSRLSLDLTYYSKLSEDALISRILAPSTGSPTRTARQNVGAVKNAGFEGLINAQLIQRPRFGWDVTLNGSTNANKLVSLGGLPEVRNEQTRQTEGYPLNGWWDRTYSYTDANSDGIILANEITYGDSAQFLGYSTPRHEVVLTNGIDLFSRRLRIQGLLDFKGGYKIYNTTEEFRCTSRNNCRARYDRTVGLDRQAAVAAIRSTEGEEYGFYEDGSFIRFRELSATFSPSPAFAQRVARARTITATIAARNLGFLMNKYSGVDPEMNYGVGDIQNEFQTNPPPSLFTFRMSVGF